MVSSSLLLPARHQSGLYPSLFRPDVLMIFSIYTCSRPPTRTHTPTNKADDFTANSCSPQASCRAFAGDGFGLKVQGGGRKRNKRHLPEANTVLVDLEVAVAKRLRADPVYEQVPGWGCGGVGLGVWTLGLDMRRRHGDYMGHRHGDYGGCFRLRQSEVPL